ncbi:MAG TPA: filamentous hemagglutinin N-terminal domain-containing protein, partial [Gammaproteobacteria bacterium]|nr:filamentous hemagglutinin N-terminal domain-containing protein [Gammaproteobacteria bacterium]
MNVIRAQALGLALALSVSLPAQAGPEGGTVVGGRAEIHQHADGRTEIHQHSGQAAIDWASFNVDADEQVRFEQPSSQAAVLNRILDEQPSQIFGRIDANGRVFLLNPNGIVFGDSARVNVGALVASTLDLTLEDFLEENYHFIALDEGFGGIINRGRITAADGGSVSLLGRTVHNEGLIRARYGQVNLGAGRRATLDFDGDGLLRFELQDSASRAAVSNSGTLAADGGAVVLTARAADQVLGDVVNNEGLIRAGRLKRRGGVVQLLGSGGDLHHSGVIDADGRTASDHGGEVTLSGDRVALEDGASISASGAKGGGRIRVGGEYRGSGQTPAARETFVSSEARLSADATAKGDGGKVIVWADGRSRYYGRTSVRGGAQGGNGGFVEISGKERLIMQGGVDARAPKGEVGTVLLDPKNIVIENNGAGTEVAVVNFGDGADPGPDTSRFDGDDLAALDANIVLQANNDITVNEALPATATAGRTLTLQAGRSILINANLSTNDGAITLTANDSAANGVVDAQRDPGAAVIAMADGTTIDAGNANITVTLSDGAGLSNNASGDITLENLTTSGHVLVRHNGPSAGGDVLRASADAQISAASVALDISGAGGGGAIGASGTPLRLAAANVEARAQAGGLFLDAPGSGFTIGGAALGGMTGLSTTGGGAATVTTAGTLQQAEAVNLGGTTTLNAGANAVTLTNAANDFQSTVNVTGGAVSLADANSLSLGTLSAG